MTEPSDLFPSSYRQSLEQELKESIQGQDGLLYNMLRYQLGWIDEQGMALSGDSLPRLHPFLCLLCCQSLSGESDPALPAAAAVELVHNFSLIHDDIQAGRPNRGHRSTVWWIWGPGQAINAGDGTHALARLALMRLADRGVPIDRVLKAMRLLDQSCLSMCEGQHMDLAFQERLDVGTDSYFKMAEGKAGALMSCAMGLGALVATEDDAVVEAFKESGKSFGVARQIKDDIRELWARPEEDMASSDVLNKKKLLPVAYAMETADISTKRELGGLYFKRVLDAEDFRKLVDILDQGAAMEFAQEKVNAYCQRGLESLGGVGLSQWGRETLERLCQQVMARDL